MFPVSIANGDDFISNPDPVFLYAFNVCQRYEVRFMYPGKLIGGQRSYYIFKILQGHDFFIDRVYFQIITLPLDVLNIMLTRT